MNLVNETEHTKVRPCPKMNALKPQKFPDLPPVASKMSRFPHLNSLLEEQDGLFDRTFAKGILPELRVIGLVGRYAG